MNQHFLLFLIDVFSWVGIGMYFGYIISFVEKNYQRDTSLIYVVTIGIALGSGILLSLNAARPATGLAIDIFFETLAFTLIISSLLYKNFRNEFLDGRRWSI